MRKITNLKTILKMFADKYPSTDVFSPVILIYDDGSGRIVRNVVTNMVYASYNCLFTFNSVDELVEHLQDKTAS